MTSVLTKAAQSEEDLCWREGLQRRSAEPLHLSLIFF